MKKTAAIAIVSVLVMPLVSYAATFSARNMEIISNDGKTVIAKWGMGSTTKTYTIDLTSDRAHMRQGMKKPAARSQSPLVNLVKGIFSKKEKALPHLASSTSVRASRVVIHGHRMDVKGDLNLNGENGTLPTGIDALPFIPD